jgi:hypothetical protein
MERLARLRHSVIRYHFAPEVLAGLTWEAAAAHGEP